MSISSLDLEKWMETLTGPQYALLSFYKSLTWRATNLQRSIEDQETKLAVDQEALAQTEQQLNELQEALLDEKIDVAKLIDGVGRWDAK